jgi:hypothetical protein
MTRPGGELRDEVRQPAYDSVVLVAGDTPAAVRRFFATTNDPVSGQPKSLARTNMEQPGQFPTATSFRVQGLCIDADAQTDNQTLLPIFGRNSSISLQVGVKNYWNSPTRFGAGRIQTALTTYQQYGWAAVQPVVFQGKHVIDINPLQQFSITWITSAQDLTAAELATAVAADTQVVFVASLKGLLRRPVQ